MNSQIDPLNLSDPLLWSDEVLEALRIAVLTEQERRRTVASAPVLAEQLSRRVIEAAGDLEGDEWHPMTWVGYPQNWTVRHGGKLWRSTTPNNVWKPGESGWREVTTGNDVPPFRKPTGAHDAYRLGERVRFEGSVYVALRDYVDHSPAEHPPSWQLVNIQPDPAAGPGSAPNPPVDPNAPAPWVPAGKAYVLGNRVTYAGKTYLVRQNHTSQAHFTPDAVLSLYLPE